jgi:hypothetical protein
MKRLLVILVVLGLVVAALAWLDVRVRIYAEGEARARLAEAIPQAERTDVELVGFPFVGRILSSGSIERLSVTLHGLREGEIEVEHVHLVADDLVLDRTRLLEERVLAVTDVGRVRVRGRVTADMIARAAGVPVTIEDGRASVTVHGQTLEASIALVGRTFMLSVAGVPPVILPLPAEQYLPCEPELTLVDDGLELACSTTKLPAAVMDILGAGAG